MIKRALGEHNARKSRSPRPRAPPGTASAPGAVIGRFLHARDPEGVLPPTINYDTPETRVATSTNPQRSTAKPTIQVAVPTRSASAGHNACLVLRRFDR